MILVKRKYSENYKSCIRYIYIHKTNGWAKYRWNVELGTHFSVTCGQGSLHFAVLEWAQSKSDWA